MQDEPLTRESLNAQAYTRLCRDLKAGQFEPGEKLKLRQIAENLGISPTPVREALARLISEQALEQTGHHSVRVPLMTPERFGEVRDLRLMLEGEAAARAAERATPADVKRLEAIHEHMAVARDAGDLATSRLDSEVFHMEVYAIAGRAVLLRMIEGLWLQCGPLMNALQTHPIGKPRKQHPHQTVLRGLRRNDVAMARLGVEDEVHRTSGPILAYLAERAAEPLAAAAKARVVA